MREEHRRKELRKAREAEMSQEALAHRITDLVAIAGHDALPPELEP